MIRNLGIGAAGMCSLTVCGIAQAQDGLAISETIVVEGQRADISAASFETRHALGEEAVIDAAAQTAAGLLGELPSVHVPTNSRGEAIAFVRNAAERQVAIFYDGAAINVPWDNRLDLSLMPSALIGNAQSAAGPLAPHYGVNVLGAISLAPRRSPASSVLAGDASRFAADALVRVGPTMLGFSVSAKDGESLPVNTRLTFHQADSGKRINTDAQLASVFGHTSADLDGHELRVTAFHVWGKKGIAPEGDRPDARFWRYPDVKHSLIVAGAQSQLGPSTDLSSTLWYQWFDQTIDSFTNAAYEVRNAREVGRDRTWGIRELLRHVTGPFTFVGSVNHLHSVHEQRDIAYVAGQPPPVLPEVLRYSQRNWSIGGGIEYAVSAALIAEVELGFDKADYRQTGGKPAIKDARDWTARAGLMFDAGGGWRLRTAVGYKMRAATMRELFGQSLNRFLVNPDLKPEEVRTVEAAAEWSDERNRFYVIPFLQDVANTIDQRNVGFLRQRINLAGSKVYGIEVGGLLRPARFLTLRGDATWARARRKGIAPGGEAKLAEKPDLLAKMSASYDAPNGAGAALEVEHVGRAFSVWPTGILEPLKVSTSFNARLSYDFSIGRTNSQIFLRVDNIADTLIEPQAGLPAPGRTFRIGVRLSEANRSADPR